jgi:Fe-Mn family superoxide dismutase
MAYQSSCKTAVCGRRELLLGAASASWATLIGAAAWAAAPPKETGLPFEGLLKGKPGFQRREVAPRPFVCVPGFLSERQVDAIYARYRGAFAQLLAAERSLQSASRAPADAARYAELRAKQLSSANSVLLHEFYFRNLAVQKTSPSDYVMANIHEHMGSFESWQEDFAACARVAGTWALLVYDPYDDRWHNVPVSTSDAAGWVGSNPLVVCAVDPQAYFLDYKNRDEYVAAFFEHIDWNAVAQRYHAVDRQ